MYSYSSDISGKPATLVNSERTPESTLAEATATQFTSLNTADTPITEIAVWATVFTALTPAHFAHDFHL